MANEKHLYQLNLGKENWISWRKANPHIIPDLTLVKRTNLQILSQSKEDFEGKGLGWAYSIWNTIINLVITPSLSKQGYIRVENLIGFDFRNTNLTSASLHGENLTKANLTGAILHGINLHNAVLQEVILDKAKINNAYLSNANFNNASIKFADFTLTVLNGSSFRNAQLSGTNFTGADIIRADFTRAVLEGCNFSEAHLSYANLTNANLYKTDLRNTNLRNAYLLNANLSIAQVLDTNFEGANLTGVCLENCNINEKTSFVDVICEYFYLQTSQKKRRPVSGEYKEGEFMELMIRKVRSHDLVFTDGIDWQAFFRTFQEFKKEDNDSPISIQSIEDSPGGEFIMRVSPFSSLDEQKFKDIYDQNLKLQERVVGYRRERVTLMQLIELYLNKPLNVMATAESKYMSDTFNIDQSKSSYPSTSMSQSKGNINISETKGNVSGITAAGEDLSMTGVATGTVSSNVTNTINQIPESSPVDALGIKQLLTELQAAIEADTNLNDEDKKDALEQVKVIAEAAQQPKDGAMQKMVKTAIKILKGTISGLPTAVQLVESCAKLLPLITKFFGLP